ncbi:hypothetical protein FGB62_142g033 [Gracilaria domingensis]|nr:hypothetical protein FGB62_142g033 [Gracilaria domingensis]
MTMAFVTPSVLPRSGLSHASASVEARPATPVCVPWAPLDIRAAKHVQFKGAKKADRRRPKKHRPSDINRKPPSFDPEPLRAEGLPPVYTILKGDEVEAAFAGKAVLASAETVPTEMAEQDNFEESSTIDSSEPQQSDADEVAEDAAE